MTEDVSESQIDVRHEICASVGGYSHSDSTWACTTAEKRAVYERARNKSDRGQARGETMKGNQV